MAQATRKRITTRRSTQCDDAALIALGRKMAALSAQASDAISLAIDRYDPAADARVDAIWGDMADVYERMLSSPPTTPEGQRALATAILHQCAATPEINEPQSDFERGVTVLLSALGANLQAA